MENVILALPYECWRWVTGFEGIAQVSTRGNVKTVGRWITDKTGKKYFIEGRILKPGRNKKNGYLYVNLSRNGKGRNFYIHRLVLEVWGDGNPENKPQVNHLDENKDNNEVYNLSWATAKENANFGTRNKRLSKAVLAIDPKTGQVVKEFASAKEAGRNGFLSRNISSCCRGEKKRHRGLIWRFKES